MKCPFCGYTESKVIDSRPAEGYTMIRRRRECLSCQKRFTTYESIERMPLVVGVISLKSSGEAASSWNLMLAGTAISMIPMILVYIVFNRFFIQGMTAGAVKG